MLGLVALGLLCFLASHLGILLTREAGSVAALWATNAVTFAVALRAPARLRPAVLGMSALGSVGANVWWGDTAIVCAAFALSNLAEQLAMLALTGRFIGPRVDFGSLRQVSLFTLFAALAPILSAPLGATALALDYGSEFWSVATTWLVANALGMLVFAPPLMLVQDSAGRPVDGWAAWLEAGLLALAVAAVAVLVFHQSGLPLLFLVFPAVILAVFRFGAAGAAVAVLVTAMVGVGFTLAGRGPIALASGMSPALAIGFLQFFLALVFLSALPMGAVLAGRARLEQQLREGEERLRFALDGANDGLWDWDVASGAVHFSPRWETMLGFTPGEVEPHVRSWERLVHPDDKAEVMRVLADHLEGRTPFYETEHRVRRKDGGWMWILDRGRVVARDGQGHPLRAVGTHTDISRRKEAEAGLARARAEAEQANRAKSVFLASMSHELRTPLNAIIGFAEMIEIQILGPQAWDRYRDYARDIGASGRHLLDLINDILDASRIEAGALPLHEERVSVAEAAQAALRMLAADAELGGVALSADVAPGLPVLWADPLRLRQVLVNLLANGVKFTPAGGTVHLSAWQAEDGGLGFAVSDTGIGIAAADLERVLEPFAQASNTPYRPTQGSGLGLPLSRRLVELHGGTLTLDSRLDQGTTVTVRFPADRVLQGPAA